MTIIDSHTHLFSDQFKDNVDQVIERAKQAGVSRFILPNIDLESVDKMHDLCDRYPDEMIATMGLHPCYVKDDWQNVLKVIKTHLDDNQYSYKAIGEIGIDLYWDQSTLEIQKQAFNIQVQWAKEKNLPIIIHARNSFDELFECLDTLNDKSLKGVFHCFTGNLKQAHKILEYGGFKLGVGGVLTFKKSGLEQVLKEVDLEHLLLETDAPYLAPTPHRGTRNESAYITLVGEKLAAIKEVSLKQVAQITTENTRQLFKLS